MALNAYHDKYHCFPPVFLADEGGRPAHSWRVLILPFLGDEQYAKLYERYRFDEPWDGPNNSTLTEQAPEVFQCPSFVGHSKSKNRLSDIRQLTNYVAVCSPQSLFPGITRLSPTQAPLQPAIHLRDVLDGPSVTISIAESHKFVVHWMQPDDASPDELLAELRSTKDQPSSHHVGGMNFLSVDGSVHFVNPNIRGDQFRALCTIAGGETISDY